MAAAERGFCLVVAPRQDTLVCITDAVRGETDRVSLEPRDRAAGRLVEQLSHDRRVAVVPEISPAFNAGAEIAFSSDLPPASGMSSSSALMVATFFALAETNGLLDRPEFPAELHDPLRLAEYLGTVENGQNYGRLQGDRGVGTFGGSEDHTAMLCAEPDRLSRFAYCPTRREGTFPLPAGYLFAIASSGVLAEKTGEAMEKYNQSVAAGRTIGRTGAIRRGRARSASKSPVGPIARGGRAFAAKNCVVRSLGSRRPVRSFGPFPRRERNDHSGRLRGITQKATPWSSAGMSMLPKRRRKSCSRIRSRKRFFSAASARRSGAAAASAFVLGFGGSVWAQIEQSQAERFLSAWSQAYHSAFPQHAARSEFFLTHPRSRRLPDCE